MIKILTSINFLNKLFSKIICYDKEKMLYAARIYCINRIRTIAFIKNLIVL